MSREKDTHAEQRRKIASLKNSLYKQKKRVEARDIKIQKLQAKLMEKPPIIDKEAEFYITRLLIKVAHMQDMLDDNEAHIAHLKDVVAASNRLALLRLNGYRKDLV